MTWNTSTESVSKGPAIQAWVVMAVLAIAVALGTIAAGVAIPSSGHALAHSRAHHAAISITHHRARHPAGQWIRDDKGGMVYIKYGP